jgi:hypothetical protein
MRDPITDKPLGKAPTLGDETMQMIDSGVLSPRSRDCEP